MSTDDLTGRTLVIPTPYPTSEQLSAALAVALGRELHGYRVKAVVRPHPANRCDPEASGGYTPLLTNWDETAAEAAAVIGLEVVPATCTDATAKSLMIGVWAGAVDGLSDGKPLLLFRWWVEV